MYEIKSGESSTSNIFAGKFPIKTRVEAMVEDAFVQKHSLVSVEDGGARETTKDTLEHIVGIAAEDSAEAGVVVYLTGEFQEMGITFPEDVTSDDVRDILRKLSIFIK